MLCYFFLKWEKTQRHLHLLHMSTRDVTKISNTNIFRQDCLNRISYISKLICDLKYILIFPAVSHCHLSSMSNWLSKSLLPFSHSYENALWSHCWQIKQTVYMYWKQKVFKMYKKKTLLKDKERWTGIITLRLVITFIQHEKNIVHS